MKLKILVLLSLVALSVQEDLLRFQKIRGVHNIKACYGTASCHVVEVTEELLSQEIFNLPVCGGMTKKNDITEPTSRSGMPDSPQSSAYTDDSGCEFIITYRNGKYMGSVSANGTMYTLEPCAEFTGCHVWKELNKKPRVHMTLPGQATSRSESPEMKAMREAARSSDSIVTYSVKFYYTVDFAEVTAEPVLFMDQWVAETNQGYINSEVPARMAVHCVEATTLRDTADPVEMLRTFADSKGSYADLRGSADAAALYVLNFDACGIAYTDTIGNGQTISAQIKDCPLTLGHEVGHNFGCLHDRITHTGDTPSRYPYGYGTLIDMPDGTGVATIMAYTQGKYTKNVNYYSSSTSTVTYQSLATGTATEDNARLITEGRVAFAALGDESVQCSSGPSPPGNAECWVKGVIYRGKRVGRAKRAKNAEACLRRCTNNSKCMYWTWYSRKFPKRALKKKCYMRRNLKGIALADNVNSGDPSAC